MEETTTSKPMKLPKLTRKERGFVNDIVEGAPGVHAALNNYDTDDYNTAGVIAHENLRKPKIIRAIAERLPDDLLEEKHLALLNKTEKVFDTQGNLLAEEIDVQAVSKGLDMAYKIKGSYQTDPEAPKSNQGNTYNFIFNPENQKDIKEIEARIKERLIQKHV